MGARCSAKRDTTEEEEEEAGGGDGGGEGGERGERGGGGPSPSPRRACSTLRPPSRASRTDTLLRRGAGTPSPSSPLLPPLSSPRGRQ